MRFEPHTNGLIGLDFFAFACRHPGPCLFGTVGELFGLAIPKSLHDGFEFPEASLGDGFFLQGGGDVAIPVCGMFGNFLLSVQCAPCVLTLRARFWNARLFGFWVAQACGMFRMFNCSGPWNVRIAHLLGCQGLWNIQNAQLLNCT